MKLSVAIVLGDPLKTADCMNWLTEDGSCGCAFGGALLAAGVTGEQFWESLFTGAPVAVAESEHVQRLWPWITADHLCVISNLYTLVTLGRRTIEDVAAYVRTIEPPDAEDLEKQLQAMSITQDFAVTR